MATPPTRLFLSFRARLYPRIPTSESKMSSDGQVLVTTIMSKGSLRQTLTCGDFNIDPTGQHNCHFQSLQEIQLDVDLTQIVSSPTWVVGSSSSTIDLFLLSSVNYLDSCDICSPIGLSDHASVHLTLTLPSKERHLRPPTTCVQVLLDLAHLQGAVHIAPSC